TRSSCGPCTSDLQCGGGSCHTEPCGERFCASLCGALCAAGYSCKAAEGGQRCLPDSGSCRGGRPLCAPCAGDLECGGPGDRCVANRTPGSPYLGGRFCGSDCGLTPGCTGGTGCTADQSKCGPQFTCAAIGTGGVPPFQCVPIRGSCTAGFARLGDSCAKAGP